MEDVGMKCACEPNYSGSYCETMRDSSAAAVIVPVLLIIIVILTSAGLYMYYRPKQGG
jgi:hypothetical protein